MSFKKIFIFILNEREFLAIVIVGVFWNNLGEVKGAETTVRVSGYAWSSNIGWIKFDPSYGGVFYNQTTGNLSGYAWSSNIGWIKFENLSANPAGIGGLPALRLTLRQV